MPAIAYLPAASAAKLVDPPDPGDPGPDEVLVRVDRVGFCGTDREIVRGGIAVLPDGVDRLILGHEMVGTVVDGPLPAGARVVATVRRGCGRCAPCDAGRSDYCLTGGYTEHGITRLDGFARPALVVPEDALVRVPDGLGDLAVLAEPMSIVVKALEDAHHVAGRIPGAGERRRALVAGAGPIGLLATWLLVERGHGVETIDVQPPDQPVAQLVTAAGAAYTRVEADRPDRAASEREPADLVVDATGDPRLAFELLGALAPGGVLVWVGLGDVERRAEIGVGHSLVRAVLSHHAVVASINSCRTHFVQALDALAVLASRPRFDEIVTGVYPPERFEEALWPSGPAVKQVVAFTP